MLNRNQFLVVVTSLAVAGSAFAAKKPSSKAPQAGASPAAAFSKTEFDTNASVLKWEGKKVTGKHDGEIKLQKGELQMDGKELKGGEFVIDMASITNKDLTDKEYNTKLITHLKSEDFFDVAKYPTGILKIKSAKSVPGFVGPTYDVTADLTLKGKTKEIQFPAVVETKNGKTTAKANITIDRTLWDIRYGSGKFFAGLGDKVIDDKFQLDVNLVSK